MFHKTEQVSFQPCSTNVEDPGKGTGKQHTGARQRLPARSVHTVSMCYFVPLQNGYIFACWSKIFLAKMLYVNGKTNTGGGKRVKRKEFLQMVGGNVN